jgi:hypothetical protein
MHTPRKTATWGVFPALCVGLAFVATVALGPVSPAGAVLPTGPSSSPLLEFVNDSANGRLWNAYNQSANAGGPNILGKPSTVGLGSILHVYTRTGAGDLEEFVNDSANGRLWNGYDLTVAASGQTIVGNATSLHYISNSIHVYARAASGHLLEYVNDNLGGRLWNNYDLTAAASGPVLAGDMAALFYNGSTIHVYGRSGNGDLLEYVNDAANGHLWNAYDLTAAASGQQVVGNPTSLFYNGTTVHIYAQATNGHLLEYVNDSANGRLWNNYDLTVASGGQSIAGDPTSLFYNGRTIHIYAQATNGHLLEYVNDSANGRLWNAYDLTVAGAGFPIVGDPSSLYYNGTTIHIYSRTGGGDLVEYVNDSANGRLWNDYDLSAAAGGVRVGGDPAAVNLGAAVHVFVQLFAPPVEQPGWTTVATTPNGIAVDERIIGNVTVARFISDRVTYSLHVGSTDPPVGGASIGPDSRPALSAAQDATLLACFNGGFMTSAGQQGFEVDGQVLVGLQAGLGSVVIDPAGNGSVGTFGQGVPAPGQAVSAVRENLQPLIINGQPSPQINNVAVWGATLGGVSSINRSALGEDAYGNLMFAGSPSALPSTMASALLQAGAVSGMELDINPDWVMLNLTSYPGGPTHASIPGQSPPSNACQAGWTRDYVAVLASS